TFASTRRRNDGERSTPRPLMWSSIATALRGSGLTRPRPGRGRRAGSTAATTRIACGDRHGGHARLRGASFRWGDGRVPSSSRYLATVRRAIDSPPCLRLRVISWSESGFWRFSWATRSWIIFLTLIDETISPRPVAIPLWKKNFSSKRPWGVWTYLLVVTRL